MTAVPVRGRHDACVLHITAGLDRVTDSEAMSAVNAGSIVAFGVLHHRYHRQAHRVARSICRDDARAQEVVQEAFLSIWKGALSYDGDRAVAPWRLQLPLGTVKGRIRLAMTRLRGELAHVAR